MRRPAAQTAAAAGRGLAQAGGQQLAAASSRMHKGARVLWAGCAAQLPRARSQGAVTW